MAIDEAAIGDVVDVLLKLCDREADRVDGQAIANEPALASSSSIFWVKSGMSKIPPEFRQAALERADVDRQEVSDVFVFHEEARGMGDRCRGQWNCRPGDEGCP